VLVTQKGLTKQSVGKRYPDSLQRPMDASKSALSRSCSSDLTMDRDSGGGRISRTIR